MPAWTGWSSDRSTARRAATCSLPVVAALTSDRLEDLTRRAGGNPFYLEQLATGSDGVADGDRSLTPGLREVLSTTRRPSAADQAGAAAAAAAGRRVDDEILAAVLEAPHAEVADALREAMTGGSSSMPTASAATRSGTRCCARSRTTSVFGERDRLHSAFAQQLALRGQVGGVPVTPAELARHWDAARNVDRAIPAWIDAGLAAERIYAFADAAAHSSARWSLGRRPTASIGARCSTGRRLCPPHR